MSFFKKKEPVDSEEFTVIFEVEKESSSVKIHVGGMSPIVVQPGESKELIMAQGKHTITYTYNFNVEVCRKDIQENSRCVISGRQSLQTHWYGEGLNNSFGNGPGINPFADDSFSDGGQISGDDPIHQPVRMTFIVQSDYGMTVAVDIKVDGKVIARLGADEKASHFLAPGIHEFQFNDKTVRRSVDRNQMCIITVDSSITLEFLESDYDL